MTSSLLHEVSACCGYIYGGTGHPIDEVTTKGHFTIVSTHPDWQGDARMYRWNVNEIECKHKKRSWCSDELLQKLKTLKLI